MTVLDKADYHKALEPLYKVTINNLFARSVVEQKVDGFVYVDNNETPSTFYVVHPYGMSLLFGRTDNIKFNLKFKDYALNINHIRNKYEWMQAFPDTWDSVLNELFKDYMIKSADNVDKRETGIIELNTRVNFKFNYEKYDSLRKELSFLKLSSDFKIIRTDKRIFQEMKGSVIPLYFWRNAEDFYQNGIGYTLIYNNIPVSTAFSAFIHDNKLELGIETIEEYRGKGFALYACFVLIDYCIKNNYEPVWACRLENHGSYRLAQKLGFEPALMIPYYRLSK